MKTSQILGLSAALAAAGLLLLSAGPGAGQRARSAASVTSVAPKPTPTGAGTSLQLAPTSTTAATATPSSAVPKDAGATLLPSNVLAPDDGPGSDHLVQAMLDAHSPHNLPPQVEHSLDQLGQAVWLADLTGQGRTQWPRYFTASGTSGYSSARVQAAATHAIGPGRAAVTLIWAGTSPAGESEVGLPGTVLLARQGGGTWEPVR